MRQVFQNAMMALLDHNCDVICSRRCLARLMGIELDWLPASVEISEECSKGLFYCEA